LEHAEGIVVIGADELGVVVDDRAVIGGDAIAFVADGGQDVAEVVGQFKELVAARKGNTIAGSGEGVVHCRVEVGGGDGSLPDAQAAAAINVELLLGGFVVFPIGTLQVH